jgi:hypothetical protein
MSAPVVLQAQGDDYPVNGRIQSLVWDGASTSGDRVVLRDCVTHELLWQGRTELTQTYLGISFPAGLSAPRGFYADVLMSGLVIVYLWEQ